MGMAVPFRTFYLETLHTIPTDFVFRIVTPCSLLCGYQYFGGICRLSLHGGKLVTLASAATLQICIPQWPIGISVRFEVIMSLEA